MNKSTPLAALLGNSTSEFILLYLTVYGEGATSSIATTLQMNKTRVYVQLKRLEAGGVVVGRNQGNQRLFSVNPRLFFKDELDSLLRKALKLVPAEQRKLYFTERRRPRRTGKPL